MDFYSLYKTEGDWSNEKRQPVNHLSQSESDEWALCGKKDVQWMGGVFSHNNGNWYSDGVKIPIELFERGTCKKCLKKAKELLTKN